jgi:predicted peroxiredoxin
LTASADCLIVALVPKLAIVASSGAADPTRASIPFHIAANGAAASGVETIIILAGDATELLREGIAADVKGVGIPPLAALLEKCAEAKIPIHV